MASMPEKSLHTRSLLIACFLCNYVILASYGLDVEKDGAINFQPGLDQAVDNQETLKNPVVKDIGLELAEAVQQPIIKDPALEDALAKSEPEAAAPAPLQAQQQKQLDVQFKPSQAPVIQPAKPVAKVANSVVADVKSHESMPVQPGVPLGVIPKVMPGNPVPNNFQPQKQPEAPQQKKLPMPRTLANSVECGADVARVCSTKIAAHDLEVLACLSDAAETNFISDGCHHLVWEFKLNVTKHKKFDEKVFEYCQEIMMRNKYECNMYEVGSGKIIPCMLNHLDDPGMAGSPCSKYLAPFASIIFADYRLICDFVEDCEADIRTSKCGKVESGDFRDLHTATHSQGKVIACLARSLAANATAIAHKCAKQIYRLSELQANDFNMDRNLYLSCRADREELCENVVAGNGAVYECLFKHKFDRAMSNRCRDAITLRQKLISQDYRVSARVHDSCAPDILRHGCMERVGKGANDHQDHVGLSSILLCLEGACESALTSFRKQLLDDYEISPEIVHSCAALIAAKCERGTVQKQGATVHCLLNSIRDAGETDENDRCVAAMMDLIKETDVENNFQLDQSLMRSCQPVMATLCKDIEPSDVTMLSCLLDRLHTPSMTVDCRSKLIDIQYFLGRDFMIDEKFNKNCKVDVSEFCNSEVGDYDSNTGNGYSPMPMELMLSCLHRYTSQHKEENDGRQLSTECELQVKRVLRVRALDYQLNPVLENACRTELGAFCSETPPKKGEELKCLQENYEKMEFDSPCQKQIQRITGWESEAIEDLESVLVRECQRMLKKFCGDLVKEKSDEQTVMECLVRNKPHMESRKCAAGVEHFQLIEMKDYKFDSKFIKHCKSDVEELCPSVDKIQTKADIIGCLSKKIRDSVLVDEESPVSEDCMEQITVEKLEIHENILLNPRLRESCEEDRRRLCAGVKSGEARVIECLREHKPKLHKDCRKELFRLQNDEVRQPKLDFQMMRACKTDLKKRCMDKVQRNDRRLILECLVDHKSDLEKTCRRMVMAREIEMFDDVNLNPDVLDSCGKEISLHCNEQLHQLQRMEDEGEDPHGVVYACLKKAFIDVEDDTMSSKCRQHLLVVIQEQEENYQLDPQLVLWCIQPIQKSCRDQNEVECLKRMYFEGGLGAHPNCMKEVASLIMESRSDIGADHALQEACDTDVAKLCRHVQEGRGKIIRCLLDVDKSEPDLLMSECRQELLLRVEMWNLVARDDVSGLQDVMKMVQQSRHANYLLSLMGSILLLVLLLGLMFGRATKRQLRQHKDR